jgi:aryl-alcohol dehydrogenase-like predicted oxidoreductase
MGGGPADKNSMEKAARLARLIEKAGCRTAAEFQLRLAASEPAIRTTIGGTSSPAHLEEFLTAGKNPKPLPAEVLSEVWPQQVG